MRTCRGFAVQCRLTNPMAVGKVKSMAPEGHASLLACEIPTAIGMVHDPRGLFRWRTKMKRSEIERKRLLAQYGHLYSNHEYERMPGGAWLLLLRRATVVKGPYPRTVGGRPERAEAMEG